MGEGHVRGLYLFQEGRVSFASVVGQDNYRARISFGKSESRSPVSTVLEDDNVPHFNLIGPPDLEHFSPQVTQRYRGAIR